MALFPAYSSSNIEENVSPQLSEGNGEGKSWLSNTSFVIGKPENQEKKGVGKEGSNQTEQLLKNKERNKDEEKVKKKKKKSRYGELQKWKSGDSDSEPSRNLKRKKKKEKKRMKRRKKERRASLSSRSSSSEDEEKETCRRNTGDRFYDSDKARYKVTTPIKESDPFYEDRKRETGNLSVPTLYRPAIPIYSWSKVLRLGKLKEAFRSKKRKNKRYFGEDWKDCQSENLFCEKTIKGLLSTESDNAKSVNSEEDITRITSDFTARLAREPQNVQLWLDYVNFQDSVHRFEKAFFYSASGTSSATVEKKMLILDKALVANPLSQELLKEKIVLADILYPPGKLEKEALEMLKGDPSNVILWRAVIHNSQYSLARCTAPGTQVAYANALERLHRLRRLSEVNVAHEITQKMLGLLFECSLFMRQAGLWELLLTLIRIYFELNLAVPGSTAFKFKVTTPDQQIRDLEDGILRSGLPMSAVWLRVERLREACHWAPLSEEGEEERPADVDPQRLVFSEDVVNLLHPISDPSLAFRLVISAFLLLKVPILPMTDSAWRCFQLDEMDTVSDAVEYLLAALYPSGFVPLKSDGHFLKGISELAPGPQYVQEKIGKDEYLNFILNLMESSANLLPPTQAVIIFTWYMRFNRLLICLSKVDKVRLPVGRAKSLKSFAKALLKRHEFRNELQLYTEYALIERELGDTKSAVRTLKTAISLRHFLPEHAPYVGLYRNLVETLLISDPVANRQEAIDVLCQLAGVSDVNAAIEKYCCITNVTFSNAKEAGTGILHNEVESVAVLTPHHLVEWIACHATFLLLTRSVWEAATLVKEMIFDITPKTPFTTSTASTTVTVWKYVYEGLYEVLINILHFHCVQTRSSYSVLRESLRSAHTEFPENVHFLNIISTIETSAGSAGSPWWKLTADFSASKSVTAKLFLVFILRSRISQSQQDGSWTESCGSNQMRSLLRKLTAAGSQGRRSPLLWRLYLQFHAALNSDREEIKRTFYRAVEECPWVKAIYMDAIQLLPESIQEIQDLLIEKELRLHSLLDELDILRTDDVQ